MASKSVSKSVIWQLFGKFALQGIAFFSTPIFTRILTPTEYGEFTLYSSWLSVTVLFLGLQTYGSIGNARMKYADFEMAGYVSSILSISIISFFIWLGIVFVFNSYFSKLLSLKSNLVILLVIHGFFYYVFSFAIAELDQFKKVEKSTLLSFFRSVTVLGLSLLAVLTINKNKSSVMIYSQALPTIFIGFFLLIKIYLRGKKLWSASYNKFCLTLTIPLLMHGMASMIFMHCDKIMLLKFKSERLLGIYGVSYGLCNVLAIIISAINVSWFPFYLDYKKADSIKELKFHTRRILKLFSIITIGFMLLSYDVYKIISPKEYWYGMKILPFLVVGNYYGFLYIFPSNFEFFSGKTNMIPICTVVASLVNIIINYLLIPSLDIYGAAIGTLVSNIVIFLLHSVVAKFYIKSNKYEQNFIVFSFCGIIVSVAVFLTSLLQDYLIIRWILSFILGLYLIIDIIKSKTIL